MHPFPRLTVLQDPTDCIADVVFVHGLQGHPRRTWACKAGIETIAESSTSSASRVGPRTSPFRGWRTLISRKRGTDKLNLDDEIFWPSDLLPDDLPNVRLLTWGYESNISRFFGAPANQNNISAHARDLLYALANERNYQRTRSLIFVVHSLGGIIVKDVLRRAADEQDPMLSDIFTSTRAVLFLGTPHRGSNMAETGEMVRKIASAAGFSTSDRNIRALHIDSSELEIVHEGFMKLYQRIPRPFEVSTFQESQGLTTVSYLGLGEKVVNDVSSSFTGTERCQTINANHMTMCRFYTKDDNGYKKIVSELKMFLSIVEEEKKRKKNLVRGEPSSTVSSVYSLNEIERLCIKLFNTSDISEYKSELPRCEEGTCQWVLSNPNYLYWYSADKSCLLWISGNLGSGKTTLSRYLLEYLSSNEVASVLRNVVCFFFCDDKVESQRDGKAILRSLIHQILIQRRKLIRHIKTAYDMQGPRLVDNFNELWRIFKAIATDRGAGSICIILDAIDECEERTRHRFLEAILSFVRELESSSEATPSVKILIISRPLLSRQYRVSQYQIEDLDSNTVQDLQLFITRKIDGIANRTHCRPEARLYLEQVLYTRADRTFLWVKLVLERLEKSPVATQKDFERLVEQLPRGLVAMYEQFLSDIPIEYHDTANKLLHLIAGSIKPLSLDEIRLLLALQNTHSTLAAVELNSQPNVRETIETVLGPLVRISDDRVSFVHQSVKDFLFKLSKQKEHPLCMLYGLDIVSCDEMLARSCISYLLLVESSSGDFEEGSKDLDMSPISAISGKSDESPYPDWNELELADDTIFDDSIDAERATCKLIAARNPLFSYASMHWTTHFQSCDAFCSSEVQRSALELCDDSSQKPLNWLQYYWLHCEDDLALPAQFNTFTVGCFFGHLTTVRTMAENEQSLDRDLISHGLYWSSWNGHDKIVSYLLGLRIMPTWTLIDRQTPFIIAARFDHLKIVKQLLQVKELEVNHLGKGGRTALSMAAGNGHLAVVECLLQNHRIQPDLPDFNKWTPIFWAVGGKYVEIVRTFARDERINLNHIDKAGRSILSWAAAAGETDVVKFLLLRNDVDIQQRDFHGRTALSWAAEYGCYDTVALLRRSRRINVSEKDNEGRNAISWAAAGGHHTVVQYLIKYDPSGADEGDENGWTPLSWALFRDSPDTVKTLLDSGMVDPNRGDNNGRTALSWAQGYGYEEVIRLLSRATMV